MSDLEEQLQEFESIQSIFNTDKLSFDPTLITKLQSGIHSNTKQNSLPNLQFTLSITSKIRIDCTLPSNYPSTAAPNLFIRSKSSKHSKSSIEDANNLLKSRICQEFEPGTTVLFDLFDWIQENIVSVITVINFNTNAAKTMPKTKLNLQRSYMWFHHIYSSTKKRNINQLARQYKLTGFCVTGKPGVIVAEGLHKNVNSYIADLKSWNWQRMIVRETENEWYCDNIAFEEGLKYKKWTFHHIEANTKGGMKVVYDSLKEGNLESYYKMIVHINEKIDCDVDVTDKKVNDGNKRKGLQCLRLSKNGLLLNVNVKPNAKETCFVDYDENCLNLRIAAQPTDGAANKELCTFIANVVGCKKSNVVVYKGHKSRDKCVLIQNLDLNHVTNKILAAI